MKKINIPIIISTILAILLLWGCSVVLIKNKNKEFNSNINLNTKTK